MKINTVIFCNMIKNMASVDSSIVQNTCGFIFDYDIIRNIFFLAKDKQAIFATIYRFGQVFRKLTTGYCVTWP